jgi:hypothetical protein
MAMIAMTTSSSISVKASRRRKPGFIARPLVVGWFAASVEILALHARMLNKR